MSQKYELALAKRRLAEDRYLKACVDYREGRIDYVTLFTARKLSRTAANEFILAFPAAADAYSNQKD